MFEVLIAVAVETVTVLEMWRLTCVREAAIVCMLYAVD
jgi:hypothetical protein